MSSPGGTIRPDQCERLKYYLKDSEYPLRYAHSSTSLSAAEYSRINASVLGICMKDSQYPTRYSCFSTSLSTTQYSQTDAGA
jgi:hypothetical protein